MSGIVYGCESAFGNGCQLVECIFEELFFFRCLPPTPLSRASSSSSLSSTSSFFFFLFLLFSLLRVRHRICPPTEKTHHDLYRALKLIISINYVRLACEIYTITRSRPRESGFGKNVAHVRVSTLSVAAAAAAAASAAAVAFPSSLQHFSYYVRTLWPTCMYIGAAYADGRWEKIARILPRRKEGGQGARENMESCTLQTENCFAGLLRSS